MLCQDREFYYTTKVTKFKQIMMGNSQACHDLTILVEPKVKQDNETKHLLFFMFCGEQNQFPNRELSWIMGHQSTKKQASDLATS